MKTIQDLRNHPVYKKIEQHPDLDDEPLAKLEHEFLNNPKVKESMEINWNNDMLINWFAFGKSEHCDYWYDLSDFV